MKSVVPSQATDKAGVPWYRKEVYGYNFNRLGKEIKIELVEGLGQKTVRASLGSRIKAQR